LHYEKDFIGMNSKEGGGKIVFKNPGDMDAIDL
jgi:hypothetical protein